MKRFLIIGPPGSGKGTQSKVLENKFDIPAISTGDIFRAHVRNMTALGKQAKNYIDKGDFVPDSVTNAMVRDRLAAGDVRQGFILDGYPRTVAQVDEFDRILNGVELDAVIQLLVDDQELVCRLLARAEKEGRNDDNEHVIRHRLALYQEQTAPVLQMYTRRGLKISVDGSGSVGNVSERLLKSLSIK